MLLERGAYLGNNFLGSARENYFVSTESTKKPIQLIYRNCAIIVEICIIPATGKTDKDEIEREPSQQKHKGCSLG